MADKPTKVRDIPGRQVADPCTSYLVEDLTVARL